jgi:hypothetical protein
MASHQVVADTALVEQVDWKMVAQVAEAAPADTLVVVGVVEATAVAGVADILIQPMPSQLLALLHLEEPQVILQIQKEAQLGRADTVYTRQALVIQVVEPLLQAVPTENSQ